MDTFEEKELVDIDVVQQNIANIEAELAEAQVQMEKYLEEMGSGHCKFGKTSRGDLEGIRRAAKSRASA